MRIDSRDIEDLLEGGGGVGDIIKMKLSNRRADGWMDVWKVWKRKWMDEWERKRRTKRRERREEKGSEAEEMRWESFRMKGRDGGSEDGRRVKWMNE